MGMHTEPADWPLTPDDQRSSLILAAGIEHAHTHSTVEAVRALDAPHTVVVHHELRGIHDGVIRRRLVRCDTEEIRQLELVHGCASCTLREDLLPLLRRLASEPEITRIVVHVDPALEPEAICWAIQHVLVDDRTVDTDVRIDAVLTTVDLATWLADATGDEELAERDVAGSVEDERTLAQVAVGQVEFADALVLAGHAKDQWTTARTEAVLHRLTPLAPLATLENLDTADLLARIPADARRGEVDGPHGPLLRGQPPLDSDAGVSVVLFEERRPFHPQRLHEAIDVLLDGVVRTRGRAWVGTQPDTVLWLESAGGGLAVGHAGTWLAALPTEQWDDVEPHRQLKASLHWDDYYGDRIQELVVITHDADPGDIHRALRHAVLTDAELAAGPSAYQSLSDPFQDWHTDLCEDPDASGRPAETRHDTGQQ
jgi:G3E family GTPase